MKFLKTIKMMPISHINSEIFELKIDFKSFVCENLWWEVSASTQVGISDSESQPQFVLSGKDLLSILMETFEMEFQC